MKVINDNIRDFGQSFLLFSKLIGGNIFGTKIKILKWPIFFYFADRAHAVLLLGQRYMKALIEYLLCKDRRSLCFS